MISSFIKLRPASFWLCAAAWLICAAGLSPTFAQQREPVVSANYRQASLYSTNYLRQFVYDTAVRPNWIGKTDEFWYTYRTSTGIRYWLVNPHRASKVPLFDHVKLAGQLTELSKRPYEPEMLNLTRVEIDDQGETMKFVVNDMQYEYALRAETLKLLGRAPRQPAGTPQRGARGEQQREQQREEQREDQQRERQDEQQRDDQRQDETQQRTEGSTEARTAERGNHRAWSPDRRAYVFAKGHDLYYVQVPETPAEPLPGETSDESDQTAKDGEQTGDQPPQEQGTQTEQGGQQSEGNADNARRDLPIPQVDSALDDSGIRLTTDGEEKYSFAGRGNTGARGGRGQQTGQTQQAPPITADTKTRPGITWSDDSQSFYVTRSDSRGVQDLWVINSLANPRPSLETYPYPMPGEDRIRKTELYVFWRDSQTLMRVAPKWKDESYSQTHYGKTGNELRFLRRDRLLRNVEFCTVDTTSGETRCLISEGFENTHIAPQPHRYLDKSDEMIWWSERSGWGHFYLYDRDGNYKNAITSGSFLANRLVDVDEQNRELYFIGSGRESGENIYYQHLYCVRFDGTGLRLLDPGDANHASTLSPTKQYLVDNYSRVDLAPTSVLRRSDGSMVMHLETADLSRLEQVGWKMPETFVVKAADGITDLYGNIFKPFDFDPNKLYPIIAHVYPGPQQEGTRHTFSATSGEQQLAQIGFIVIQVGHRGGSPSRSKAYGSFGYFNLRDYGLADKKAAIEQLAQMYPYIDLERIGIYGHSGGGFMTAAALLVPPYNDFFKVGVSTAGNHDNNIYNNSWSERYHGLREVAVNRQSGSDAQRRAAAGGTSGDQTSPNRDDYSGFSVHPTDFFYAFEMQNEEDQWDLDRRLFDYDPFDSGLYLWQDEQQQQQEEVQRQDTEQQQDGQTQEQRRGRRGNRGGRGEQQQQQQTEEERRQQDDGQRDEQQDQQQDGQREGQQQNQTEYRFEIRVPTTVEVAANLKGKLLLVHGELDNNVHPANTLRLVDALIKANKRFDMLYLPNTRHGFGSYQPYVTQRMFEYFAEHLLNDYQRGADIMDKK